MNTKLKNEILLHLSKKGSYEPGVDDYLVDILLENLEYSSKLQKMISEQGIIVTIPNGNGIPTTKENPAFGSYTKCLSNIFQCAVKLGINRKDRITLKILEEKQNDGFDNDFE